MNLNKQFPRHSCSTLLSSTSRAYHCEFGRHKYTLQYCLMCKTCSGLSVTESEVSRLAFKAFSTASWTSSPPLVSWICHLCSCSLLTLPVAVMSSFKSSKSAVSSWSPSSCLSGVDLKGSCLFGTWNTLPCVTSVCERNPFLFPEYVFPETGYQPQKPQIFFKIY